VQRQRCHYSRLMKKMKKVDRRREDAVVDAGAEGSELGLSSKNGYDRRTRIVARGDAAGAQSGHLPRTWDTGTWNDRVVQRERKPCDKEVLQQSPTRGGKFQLTTLAAAAAMNVVENDVDNPDNNVQMKDHTLTDLIVLPPLDR